MSGTKQKSIRAEREKKKSVWKNWQLYIMCLPAVIYFLIFAYKPMYLSNGFDITENTCQNALTYLYKLQVFFIVALFKKEGVL